MLNIFWKKTSMTFKITLVFLFLSLSTSALFLGARAAMAASLKNISIINEDVLRLGDLFDGVTRNADYVIGAAPQPGEDMVLNARTLYRIAISLDLPWRPLSSGDSITVRREATVIPASEIKQTLRDELVSKGVNGKFNLNIHDKTQKIVLPKDENANLVVQAMNINSQNDNFSAVLVAPSLENPIKTISVSGSIERIASVPVLRDPLRNGDIIGKNDIEWIEIPERKLQHNIIMRSEDIIGLTPRRVAYAGKVLLSGELERPQLVKRGENVNITFKDGPLILTTKGRALQSGAKGDLIRVTNTNSSRNVDAFVTAENQVVVQ